MDNGRPAISARDQENLLMAGEQPIEGKEASATKTREISQQHSCSIAKPLRIIANEDSVECRSRMSFKKKDISHLSQQLFPARESRNMAYGISGLDLTGMIDKSRFSNNESMRLPNINEVLKLAESFAERFEGTSENEHSLFKIRAMHRLIGLLSRIMQAPPNNDELIMMGGAEHQDSLNLLIDRYQFELDEKQRELNILRQRLEVKEQEILKCQKTIMCITESQDARHLQYKEPLVISRLSSLASPHPTRKSMSLDNVSEVGSHKQVEVRGQRFGSPNALLTEPFIKVCDGYSAQETVSIKHQEDIQFIVGVAGETCCLFEPELSSPSREQSVVNDTACFGEQEKSLANSYESLEITSRIQLKPPLEVVASFAKYPSLISSHDTNLALDERVNNSIELPSKSQVEISRNHVASQTCECLPTSVCRESSTQSEELLPLFLQPEVGLPEIFEQTEYQVEAPITVQDSRNALQSMQPLPLTDREWSDPSDHYRTARTNTHSGVPKRTFKNVVSMSISHTTAERDTKGKLSALKRLVKCLADLTSSSWKLILHSRKKSKSEVTRSQLTATKEKIECFEEWFNAKYDDLAEKAPKESPQRFFDDTVDKIREFTGDLEGMIDRLCDAAK